MTNLGPVEVLPGATRDEVLCVAMHDVVPGYSDPDDALEEWAWLHKTAMLEHNDKLEYVLYLDDAQFAGVPPRLQPVLQQASAGAYVYLCVHHAASPGIEH